MPDYARRQNTDNYHVRTERQLTRADTLLRDLDHKVDSLDELIERDAEVSDWLASSRANLESIYLDEEVFNGLENRTGLDLNELSHLAIIERLREIVTDRIAALSEIRERTRVYGGRGN
ncbi:MAG: hypothetical protein QOD75_117 [Blastocatellia bacterium]|jgi:hypothetical protein|nr:hypothetical protein [Blastocatellia bacterium]